MQPSLSPACARSGANPRSSSENTPARIPPRPQVAPCWGTQGRALGWVMGAPSVVITGPPPACCTHPSPATRVSQFGCLSIPAAPRPPLHPVVKVQAAVPSSQKQGAVMDPSSQGTQAPRRTTAALTSSRPAPAGLRRGKSPPWDAKGVPGSSFRKEESELCDSDEM